MSQAPPIPLVARRGTDGRLGTGEYATMESELYSPSGSVYPLDIANSVNKSAVQASARWVPTIVERNFTFLHAKFVLTDRALLLGSANWSDHSASRAFELDVLLQTERELSEAYQLFELLWTSSAPNEITSAALQDLVSRAGDYR